MPGSVRGLKESERAFKKMARTVPAAQQAELRVIGDEQERAARGRLSARVGGFRMKRHPSSFHVETLGKGASAVIEADGTSLAAEFGAESQTVFGRRVSQSSMKARTAGRYNPSGYMLGPEFRAGRVRVASRRLADAGFKDVSKQLDRAGVPR